MLDGAMPQERAADSKPMQQTRVSVGSVTTAAAKCELHSSLTIIELSYHRQDIFYLSCRLLIENSI